MSNPIEILENSTGFTQSDELGKELLADLFVDQLAENVDLVRRNNIFMSKYAGQLVVVRSAPEMLGAICEQIVSSDAGVTTDTNATLAYGLICRPPSEGMFSVTSVGRPRKFWDYFSDTLFIWDVTALNSQTKEAQVSISSRF